MLVTDDAGDMTRPEHGLFVGGERLLAHHQLSLGSALVSRSAHASGSGAEYELATALRGLSVRRRYRLDRHLHEEILVAYAGNDASDAVANIMIDLRFAFEAGLVPETRPLPHPQHGFAVGPVTPGGQRVEVVFSAPPALDVERLVAAYPLKLPKENRWRLSVACHLIEPEIGCTGSLR